MKVNLINKVKFNCKNLNKFIFINCYSHKLVFYYDKFNYTNNTTKNSDFVFNNINKSSINKQNNTSNEENYKKYSHIVNKLDKDCKKIKIYDALYDYSSEIVYYRTAYIFSTVIGSVLLFSNLNMLVKCINLIFFIPCLLISIDGLKAYSVFVKQIYLTSKNSLDVVTVNNKCMNICIEDIVSAKDNKYTQLGNIYCQSFHVFCIKNTKKIFYVAKSKSVLNEDLFNDIIKGNRIYNDDNDTINKYNNNNN